MSGRWWNRVAGAIALSIAGACILTGCLPPGIACPAIMYLSSVDVHVDGQLAFLDACAGSDCGSSSSESAADITIWEKSSGLWTIEFISGAPDELTLRALDTSGILLAEEEFALVWTPVGESGPCPGPVRTEPIDFSVG